MKLKDWYLFVGGIGSFAIAILHIAIIIGGEEWYRFFGAGEEMALMAKSGSITPVVLTSVIVILFTLCGLYAFSGAGIIRYILPLRIALIFISVIYLLRGFVGILAIFFPESSYFPESSENKTFVLITSIMSLFFGLLYALGTYKSWSNLSNKST